MAVNKAIAFGLIGRKRLKDKILIFNLVVATS
jgi:hypothetical protein